MNTNANPMLLWNCADGCLIHEQTPLQRVATQWAEIYDEGQVYQVMLFDDSSYILMIGLVSPKHASEYVPEFKAMAHSLTRKTGRRE